MVKEEIYNIPNLFKIPYHRFNQLLVSDRLDLNRPFHIFINLDRVFYFTFQSRFFPKDSSPLSSKDSFVYQYTAELINLLLHYRNFFLYQKRENHIYFYSTDYSKLDQCYETSLSPLYYFSYQKINGDQMFYREEIIRLMERILPYITNCYILSTRETEGISIPLLFQKENTILISNDLLEMQYYSHGYSLLPIIIRMKRGGLQYETSFHDMVPSEYNLYQRNKYFYLFRLLTNEYRNRSLQNITKKTCSPYDILEHGLVFHHITDQIKSFTDVLSLIDDEVIKNEIELRYRLLSIEYKENITTDTEKERLQSLLQNIYDPNGLERVNKEFFFSRIRTDFI